MRYRIKKHQHLIIIIPLLLMYLFSGCTDNGDYYDYSINIPVNRPIIVIIGNSVGCGYYSDVWEDIQLDEKKRLLNKNDDASNNGWSVQLRVYIESKGGSVLNLSGDGWRTGDHLGLMLPWQKDVISQIIEFSPDYVLLPIIINDCYKNIPVDSFISNYISMVSRLNEAGIKAVCVLENPIEVDGYIDYINAVINISASYNTGLIDNYNCFLNKNDMMYDFLHPNQNGHNLMFEQYKNYFDNIFIQ